MATRVHPVFNNFSSGEITPKIDGRIDLTQYFNGLQLVRNWICVPQGGIKTRGGFHFVTKTKNSEEARLIPFSFSELQNYMLLFGDKYIWVFTDCGQVIYDDNPYEILSPYSVDDDLWSIRYAQDDENLYLIHPLYPPMILTKGAGHTSFTIDEIDFIGGPYEDEINTPMITPSATTGDINLTASGNLFMEGHEGALWRIRHGETWGYVKITSVLSPTSANATVKKTLGGITASDGHREGSWSGVNGFPRAICFHESKLLFASNYEHPQTIWASKTGKYTDFTPGTLDNDPYSFTLADLNIIRWVAPAKNLCIGALNAEATAVGPNDGPITATDPPRIKSETPHGSSDLISPVKVGKAIIFLQRAGQKLREFVFSYTEDAHGAPDLTIASEHMFREGIIDLVYQQEPDSILWAIRKDGLLLACTYDRYLDPTKGGIVGWSRHQTDGLFESIATIPHENTDQLWAIVIREIDGVNNRYIEYYDPSICVDSGLTYSGPPVSEISGLDHLIKKTVQIVGDGAIYPSQKVPASGQLTIDPPASEIYVGLGYTPKAITNRPEVNIAGTSQGLKKRWSKIIVRVLETMGISVNGQILPARSTSDSMDKTPTPYTGELNVENLGWDTEGRITIEQPLPIPAHIVCITGNLVIGDD